MKILPVIPTGLPSAYVSPERLAMQAAVRRFAYDQVLPAANRLDPIQGAMPENFRTQMAEMGLFGILIDQKHGGLGLGIVEYCLVTEELARAWMSVASLIARGNNLISGLPRERAESLLPLVARGEFLGAGAISEPDAGSDLSGIRTRATRVTGGYVINGQKMWCTFADGADFLLLLARVEPAEPGTKHSALRRFLIPKERGSFPSQITGNPVRKIGYHGWKTWELSIDDLWVPDEACLPEPEGMSGFASISETLTIARVHTAARSIGLARGSLEDAVDYCTKRRQFGRPIGDFQALRFKVATMAAEIAACRALMYETAADADAGVAVDQKASMLKFLASEMAERVTSEGLQIHGGAGYTTDFPAERYWRDARLTKIFEGTSEIQLRIISDRLLPKPMDR